MIAARATAVTMPKADVMYDAFPRLRAALLACGPASATLRRANTAVYTANPQSHSL